MKHIPCIALTPGEAAGIGPDLAVRLARKELDMALNVYADPSLLEQRAALLGIPLRLYLNEEPVTRRHQAGSLCVVPVKLRNIVVPGRLDPANADYVLECLRRACLDCTDKKCDALVTGPVHKGVINEAGIPFSGHTEFLAARTHTPRVVMMLAVPGLRVALVTTHLPLAEVSAAVSATRLEETLRILRRGLRDYFTLDEPRISVCGLNPHAGEGGHLGQEEIKVIIPVLEKLRREGMRLRGPLPADTAFTRTALEQCDAVLSMYHDQGLPVLKHKGFGKAVNITLGLPLIRTSVDHGTALELAGSAAVDGGSLQAALDTACAMRRARSR